MLCFIDNIFEKPRVIFSKKAAIAGSKKRFVNFPAAFFPVY
jgi:hypothetical protein